MSEAKRDNNYITTLLAVSNVDGETPVTLYADPTTHRLLVSATGAGSNDKVGIDSGATAGYIGAANNDGVLRVDSSLDYTDGGDYVTLGLDSTLKTNYDAASTHVSSDGSDHTYIDQDVTSGSSPTFDGANITGIPATGVEMSEIGTATYDDVQDWSNLTQSSGMISGFTITDSGSGQIDIASGTGIIKSTDSAIGDNYFFDYAGTTNVALTDNSANYVYIEYNAGTPQAGVETTKSKSNRDAFYIGKVYRDGTTLHIVNAGALRSDAIRNIQARFTSTETEFTRASGLIIGDGGSLTITLTQGVVWNGLTREVVPAYNSGTTDFNYWYNDGAWQSTATGTISNTQYNDYGTGLATLTSNKYGVHWVYVHDDGDIGVVYGIGDYTLAGAQALSAPDNLPDIITNFAHLAAKIIIQKNSASFYSLESAFENGVAFTPVSDHGALAGLSDDDHPQYIKDSEFTQDSGVLVGTGAGTFAEETGATLRTSLGLGTGDSPQFTGIELGHASDTTLTRPSAGDVNIEGNIIYRAGGTDVAVADGGTGQGSYTDGQLLIGNTTGNTLAKSTLTAGAGIDITNGNGSITIDGESASTTNAGIIEIATSAEVDTGTDATRAVSPDSLAGSDLGTRYAQIVVIDYTTDTATGDGKAYLHIPAALDGMNLVEVHAEVITAPTGSTETYMIHNLTQTADMLSTAITIDATETGSDTAATAPVIDTANDDVAENDLIRIDIDGVGSTSAAKGLIVTMGFQLP